jgi:hypothetical protein
MHSSLDEHLYEVNYIYDQFKFVSDTSSNIRKVTR